MECTNNQESYINWHGVKIISLVGHTAKEQQQVELFPMISQSRIYGCLGVVFQVLTPNKRPLLPL